MNNRARALPFTQKAHALTFAHLILYRLLFQKAFVVACWQLTSCASMALWRRHQYKIYSQKRVNKVCQSRKIRL